MSKSLTLNAANSMVVSRTGWRTIFYVGIALNTIGATLSFFFYKPAKPLAAQGISRRKILANFDWTGLVALTVSVGFGYTISVSLTFSR